MFEREKKGKRKRKKNIPKFLSKCFANLTIFEYRWRRKEKIRKLLGEKVYRSSKGYPKVKFKSYVFRKGRMKFRR